MRDVVVIGAGMHRYGVFEDKSIIDLGTEAIKNALDDANMKWEDIQEAFCGTIQPGMSTGHQICNRMGFTGLGITNVENASASGSSAFREAFISVASGMNDIALAFGVDKLPVLQEGPARPSIPHENSSGDPASEDEKNRQRIQANRALPVFFFAHQAQEHMKQYGTTVDQLALVSVKSHYNASLNPYAHFQKTCTIQEVKTARTVADPLTVLQCCPRDEGAAAVIVCARDLADTFTGKVCPTVAASVLKSNFAQRELTALTEICGNMAYEKAGIGPEDLDLIELHDAFTIEEIQYVEALGLCPVGDGGRLVADGVTSLTGRHPVNSSGGLISMGHPIGPTGAGQIAEVLWQMRGECGRRQIQKPVNTALAHMVGAGGVCIIHVFKK